MRAPLDGAAAVDVMMRRYRGGQFVDSKLAMLAAHSSESQGDLLRRAVTQIAATSASSWKTETPAGYDQQGTLTALLQISDLDDWVLARQRLAGVPTIRKVSLMALSRQEATIEIGYVGSIDQLKASLAGISLDLVPGDPAWRLARTAPGRALR